MSYSSIPTEPENATTAIGGRRYSSDTPTRIFYNEHTTFPNNDSIASKPPPSQLRRSSKIRRSSGEVKRQSIISKLSSKHKLVSPENENPQHIKIVLPLPSQLSKDFKNEQESFPIDSTNSNKTVSEVWKMPWIEESDKKFSKKFWLVFVIALLIFFGFVLIGFGIYAYYTYDD